MNNLAHIDNAIIQNRQIYNNISAKPNAFVNLSSQKDVYTSSKVQYYNDEKSQKAQKDKKLSKILVLGFSAVSILGLGATAAIQILKHKVKIQDIPKIATDTIDAAMQTQAGQTAKKWTNKILNMCINLDALKNNIWTGISNKLHLNKFDDYIANTYSKLSIKESLDKYAKSSSRINIFNDLIGKNKLKPQEYEEFCSDMANAIKNKVSPEGGKVYQVLFEGFKKTDKNQNFIQRMKNGFKTFWKNGTKEVIADTNLNNVYKKYTQGLEQDFIPNEIFDSIQNMKKALPEARATMHASIVNQIKKLLENQDLDELKKAYNIDDTDKLAQAIAKDYEQLDFLYSKGARNIAEKQRDLKLGNASVDVLGMTSTIGMLGVGVAKAEDKKEKESIMLDLGIPLTSSMIFSFVGGLKNISGVASMLTGLAVGSATSLGVKLIQSLKGNKEQQNSTTV